ncbi:conserved protein of unknown function [Rhodovastum atsumiense]|uniref:Spermidine synthase n=1 Tax=Rhodovastum atsumiense TaxID=504468 RepID=A0A5M6ISQ8_9PROT|nr:hypothetical protein [Rhodovastum atsumiense]KAA5611354.1 hypothetical protein F1189_14530 [Rhodovastum atsumiense]CAH2603657.1 conserved protein of unknown function [Rhodovastum atsumiense]
MEEWIELAAAGSPEARIVLRRRGGTYEIRFNGWELMSSRAHHSEEVMARRACAALPGPAPRVLIGGLGMGFMVRAALDVLPPSARVEVAEIFPEVLAWNRGPLAGLAGRPLEDPRVCVRCEDVSALLRAPGPGWDAVLLDVDNGPGALTLEDNGSLYGTTGLRLIRAALLPGGCLAVWSADRSTAFEAALREVGLGWQCQEVTARGDPGDPRHALYFAYVPNR